ncbi:hypothetical protein OH76DRAFT_460569 [Lentinus brumalis]|uniref:Uncharacterized protein n=1 Tax=Lentinus brumalis TaxID=2498619 RepID=A0A371CIF1_9APHY|nr:hypothetical protein OH76DRAFT_460569 [Polyporus brumalis]
MSLLECLHCCSLLGFTESRDAASVGFALRANSDDSGHMHNVSHVDGMRSHGCTSLPASTSGLHNPTRLEDQANAARLKPVQSLRHLIRLVALARNVCSLSDCM